MLNNISFKVKGMNCKHCKMAVEQALLGLAGVTEVKVDLEKASVSVNYQTEEVNIEKMKRAIREAGYQPE